MERGQELRSKMYGKNNYAH